VKTTLVAIAAFIALALVPTSSARAPTCEDYSTQAEAQRAADTRDADGDGIYCESLPCPCSRGGSTPAPPTPAVAPSPPPSSSAPPSTSASAGRTQRLVYSPFGVDRRVVRGISVVSRTGDCWIGSLEAAGAYRCAARSRLHDPCYASPMDNDAVVCTTAPWAKTVVRIKLTEPLPEPATSRDVPRAWAIELVSGNRCSWMGGATLAVRGFRLNYACGRNRYLFGAPRTGSRFWKIRLSRGVSGKRMRLVSIKRAWR
jgi:hypothetical protein